MDIRIIGPDGPIPNEGPDKTGMYTLLAQGVKTWVQQNDPAACESDGLWRRVRHQAWQQRRRVVPDLMHYDLGGSRGALRPEVQFGNCSR